MFNLLSTIIDSAVGAFDDFIDDPVGQSIYYRKDQFSPVLLSLKNPEEVHPTPG